MQEGGSLSFALTHQPASFNLDTRKGHDLQAQLVMDRVWPQVFVIDAQGVPQLDTNFVKSAETGRLAPQTIVYQIDDRATWSDGVPITADDFIYNWEAQSGDPVYADVGGKPFDAASTAGYSQIESVTGSNRGKTVTVVFKTPYGDWKSLFNNLIPAHIARTVGWNTGFDASRSKSRALGKAFRMLPSKFSHCPVNVRPSSRKSSKMMNPPFRR